MDLKIKDIAKLLNVSETTIRRWLVDGKIPAYKLNHQYRFSSMEIENWMMKCKLSSQDSNSDEKCFLSLPSGCDADEGGVGESSRGLNQFSLYRAVYKGGVISGGINFDSKDSVIRAGTKVIANNLNLDCEILTELLLDREKLMPTALNNGVGVPHPRDCFSQAPFDFVTVVFLDKPIEYGALDGNLVHTLFFLFATCDEVHLQLLAKIANLSANEKMLAVLKSRPARDVFLNEVKVFESRLVKSQVAV